MTVNATEGEIAVIADLLTILSKYDARTIGAARHRGGISDNLRAALDALAREAQSTSRSTTRPEPRSEAASARARFTITEDAEDYFAQLLAYLTDETRFSDKRTLLELSERLGLQLDGAARDSKRRMAVRLARTIAANKKLRKRLPSVLEAENQTTGWMNVILDAK